MNTLTLILAGGAGSTLSILGEKRAKPGRSLRWKIQDHRFSSFYRGQLSIIGRNCRIDANTSPDDYDQ